MSKQTIIMVVIILVLAIFAGVVVGVVFWKKTSTSIKEVEKFNLTVDDMYCNIKDSKRILKLKITVESINPKSIEKLTEKVFLVRDEVNKIVRDKTDEQLEGTDGQTSLQKQIKDNLIILFEDETITNVYFNDFIIQ